MRLSRYFCPTLKETPREADVISQQLMIRSGMIRRVSSGIYTLLPLGLKVMRKFELIVREELDRIGFQEMLMPMVIPSQLWQDSNRWDAYGPELLTFSDRHENTFCLGPTHEEVITDLVRQNVRSYRQLPLLFYQIQTKFRDEIRPRFGVMRSREFVMKDAYSFHESSTCLNETYRAMRDVYRRIFERCGLDSVIVEADSGSIGGDESAEFMVLADTGEDEIVMCKESGRSFNMEQAPQKEYRQVESTEEIPHKEALNTPHIKTIPELASFLSVSASQCLKSMMLAKGNDKVMILLAGNRQLNDVKVMRSFPGYEWIQDEAILTQAHLCPGFIGPVDLNASMRIVADYSIRLQSSWVCGANRKDMHLQHAELGRDFEISDCLDLANVLEGDPSEFSTTSTYSICRGIEVGHIFKLGHKYSEAMSATYQDKSGKSQTYEMGCYGIGIGRTVAAAIEQHHDEKGICWPRALAPFSCTIIPASLKKPELVAAAEKVYQWALKNNVDAVLDDRDAGLGFKLKDADLIGIPYRIVIGKRYESDSQFECISRDQEIRYHKFEELDQVLDQLIWK